VDALPLQSTTASGTSGSQASTPAESSWMTRSLLSAASAPGLATAPP
jgi:hypothetical protein